MYEGLLFIFLIISIALVTFIMLQQGKGSGMGGSLGANISSTLFGSSGSTNFMVRTTVALSILFFTISLILGNINSNKTGKSNDWKNPSTLLRNKSNYPEVPTKPISNIPK